MAYALTSALLAPEVVHPTQFFDSTVDGGEVGLMCAVIVTAWDDAFSKKPYHRLYRVEAREFFASDDRSWPYSFLNICEAIDLDPDAVRRALREGKPDGVKFVRDESGTRTHVSAGGARV